MRIGIRTSCLAELLQEPGLLFRRSGGHAPVATPTQKLCWTEPRAGTLGIVFERGLCRGVSEAGDSA